MDRIISRPHSELHGQSINRAPSPLRVRSVPYISIVLASVVPVIVIADVMPLIPPLGFLMLLGWRMVRPGLLPLWVGGPLGAVDDLVSGQPFGSAILLWSLALMAIEMIETRFPWRGFWQDWFTAGLIAAAYWLATLLVSGAAMTMEAVSVAAPQAVLSILLYPIIARLVARLDQFRLARARRIA
ncbi:MAG: rod shape-determining protein MreD [Erythrobacter sp.]|nr:rod shape-determining protein MreD [Erythrobacter sp.]